jgi:protein gp37
MSYGSKIEWTHHTFNPWWGCTKVGPGCDNCYAEAFDHRLGGDHWGTGKPRREFGDKHWNMPLAWDRMAAKLKTRHRVFCASMADVFDNEVPREWRYRLYDLVRSTPNLDWLLLTKRIGNAFTMLPLDFNLVSYPNVWIGATVVNQAEADRDIPKLLAINTRVRFLSIEPMLGPISFEGMFANLGNVRDGTNMLEEIEWVIVGGESGHGARPFVLGYAKDIVRQCKTVGTPVFVKQMGDYPTNREGIRCPHIKQPKGADMSEWPEELRIREYPA